MKKRLLPAFLALVMVLSLLPTTSFAASSDFTIEDGVLIKYTGPGGNVTIPGNVTSIGHRAFYLCNKLTSVAIPDSVTSIEDEAFAYCDSLISVVIPDGVTKVDYDTFNGCESLVSVTIPDSVTIIENDAFRNCKSLASVTIPNGVTHIGQNTFSGCESLTSITIPNGVTRIGLGAFAKCSSLNNATIPDSVTIIDLETFYGCTNMTSVTIPSSVTSIYVNAFNGCYNLTDVYYGGNKAQWDETRISDGNDALAKATIHYADAAPTPSATGGFSDVKESDYFAQPVLWAVGKGVTSGTGAGTFSPNAECTVAHILTFLWRANNSPEPARATSLPGIDDGAYYYKPAAWAVEKGLTDSVSPDAPCTRSMVVSYLWKLAGSPSAGTSKFTDVPPSADYTQAVAWAVQQGITSGTGENTFSPDKTCTRGQIVTFLYSAFVKGNIVNTPSDPGHTSTTPTGGWSNGGSSGTNPPAQSKP